MTVLDDRSTRALQVNVTVPTVVHPELFACHYNHAILNSSHMGGPVHLAADQQALVDVLQRQTGQGLAADGGHGQVDDAAFERGEGAGRRGVRGGRRQYDMHRVMPTYGDRVRGGKGRFADRCCPWFQRLLLTVGAQAIGSPGVVVRTGRWTGGTVWGGGY